MSFTLRVHMWMHIGENSDDIHIEKKKQSIP